MTSTDFAKGQRDFQDWLTLRDVDLVKLTGPERHDTWRGESFAHDRWRMTISHHHVRYTIDYHMGVGHEGRPPSLVEVVAAIISDSVDYVTNVDWEEYARNFEPDLDACTYRQIQRYRSTYRQMGEMSRKVAKLLPGVDLVNDTELRDLIEAAGL